METTNFLLNNHLAQTTPYNMGIEVERADGIYIYDVSGKSYMDLISGLAVSAGSNSGRDRPRSCLRKLSGIHAFVFSAGKSPQRQLWHQCQRPLAQKSPGGDAVCSIDRHDHRNRDRLSAIELAPEQRQRIRPPANRHVQPQ